MQWSISENLVYCKVDLFVKMIYYKGTTTEHEQFPMYLLGNPRNMCCNTQNRTQFSKMIDLRGHMPRFTFNMHVFLCIFLETPEMCVATLRAGLTFLRQLT